MSKERFIVAEKNGPQGILLVITDADIIGKTFTEGKITLNLTKQFYEGKEMTKEEAGELCQKSMHLHLTGKHAVALGIELEFVDANKILYVQGIPHAEVVMG